MNYVSKLWRNVFENYHRGQLGFTNKIKFWSKRIILNYFFDLFELYNIKC